MVAKFPLLLMSLGLAIVPVIGEAAGREDFAGRVDIGGSRKMYGPIH